MSRPISVGLLLTALCFASAPIGAQGNESHAEVAVRLIGTNLEPLTADLLVLRDGDGHVVQPSPSTDGALHFNDVGRKLIFEFTARDMRKATYETVIDVRARAVWFEICLDPTNLEIKGITKKEVYPHPKNTKLRAPAAWGGGPQPTVLPPSNDDCASAEPIFDGDTAFSTVDATTDGPVGSGCQFDGQTYHDIWYTYTATCNGTLTVSTCGTADYDTDLVLYEGADCGALEDPPLACNDDTGGCAGFTSMVSASVTMGNEYLIRIGGFNDGDMGTGVVNVTCTPEVGGPPNDLCSNAIPIFDGDTAFSTIDATTDGPPGTGCQFDGQTYHDIWYTYTATCTGMLTVSTCNTADYDSDLVLYDGADCGALEDPPLACNDDGSGCAGFSSMLTAPVTMGNDYLVRIGGFNDGDMGTGIVNISCEAGGLSNDECDGATLVDCNSSATVNNLAATTNPTDPEFSCRFGSPAQGFGTVWYKFVATDTNALLDTNSSLVSDTLLAVYDGSCGNLTEIACSEDEGIGLLSEVCAENLVVGNTYYVQVASFSAASQGEITLTITCPCPAPPENDDCEAAIALGSPPIDIMFDTSNATDDHIEAPCGVFSGPFNNVWYSVTGTGTTMTATTCTPGTTHPDTKISVYCGDCGELVCVGGNDDDCADFAVFASTVNWCSQPGVEYLITVGGFTSNQVGPVELSITDDGVPCIAEVQCLPQGACCLDDGTCVVAIAEQCAAMGGEYQGDDTQCVSNSVVNGGFEAGQFGGGWTEFSSNFGTPVCSAGLCGLGGGTGPRSGMFWSWFGGIPAPEDGSLDQMVAIDSSATNLEFYMEIPVSSGNGTDFMRVLIDGMQVYEALESDGPFVGYQLVSIPLGGFADGGMHALRFESSITGDDGMGNAAFTNFFVDDVSINVQDVECRTCYTIDFETQDDFATPLANGEAINSPPDFGNLLLVNGFGPNTYGTAIFDSNPAGPNSSASDQDLLVDSGNILILQENQTQTVPGFYDFPDDAQLGGTMTFDFVNPIELMSVDLIDICPGPPIPQDVTLVLMDNNGLTRTYFVPGGWTTDLVVSGGGGIGTLALDTLADQPGATATATAAEDAGFNAGSVVRLTAHFASSGALDNLTFCE